MRAIIFSSFRHLFPDFVNASSHRAYKTALNVLDPSPQLPTEIKAYAMAWVGTSCLIIKSKDSVNYPELFMNDLTIHQPLFPDNIRCAFFSAVFGGCNAHDVLEYTHEVAVVAKA